MTSVTQNQTSDGSLAPLANSTVPPYGVRAPGYRLPETTRLGHVSLQVADLERSLAYYQRVLGLRLLSRTETTARLGTMSETKGDAQRVAESTVPGSAANAATAGMLVELHEHKSAAPVPRRGRLGLYHFAILVPDRAVLGRFVRHLHDIGAYFGSSDHYVSEALYLTDPDGLGIEVYADRPRSTWRVQQSQLAMASDPLDLDDLIRAAGDTPWSGMPSGTVVGHVHLYVGDLDQAAQFYHAGLGMDKIVWSYPGALFLSAAGYHHHLGTNTWAAGAPVATERDARLLEWNVLVTDAANAEQAARSIEALGYVVESLGDSWVATDPWGVRVRIGAGS